MRLTDPLTGWAIEYEQGARLADLFDPEGSCVECLQVRPWDWALSPWEQEPHTVTDRDLMDALQEYLSEQGLWPLA